MQPARQSPSGVLSAGEIRPAVEAALGATKFIDLHTHLFMPSLGALGLWGIDNLVTYHYLEAELFRSSPVAPAEYWKLSTTAKADGSPSRKESCPTCLPVRPST